MYNAGPEVVQCNQTGGNIALLYSSIHTHTHTHHHSVRKKRTSRHLWCQGAGRLGLEFKEKQLGTLRKIGNCASGDPVIGNGAESLDLGIGYLREGEHANRIGNLHHPEEPRSREAEQQKKGETANVVKLYAPCRFVIISRN